MQEEVLALPPASGIVDTPAVQKEDSRFNCPFPGCNRSFGELWRLKVHYRAPPEVRGSGKERGHGTELDVCPKCWQVLQPGKHHVGCASGKTTQRKRSRKQSEVSNAGGTSGPWNKSVSQKAVQLKTEPGMLSSYSHSPLGDNPNFQQAGLHASAGILPVTILPGPTHGVQHSPLMHPASTGSSSAPQLTAPGENDFLHKMFEDEEPLNYIPSIPSPPHLPRDFPLGGGLGHLEDVPVEIAPEGMAPPSEPPPPSDDGLLFNFGQFSQRMPVRAGAQTLEDPLWHMSSTAEQVLSTSPNSMAVGHDDGDIMHLLFGAPDELPTMSTIHMHQRSYATNMLASMDEMDGMAVAMSASGPVFGIEPPLQGQQQQQQQQVNLDTTHGRGSVWGLNVKCEDLIMGTMGEEPLTKKHKLGVSNHDHDKFGFLPAISDDAGPLASMMRDSNDSGFNSDWGVPGGHYMDDASGQGLRGVPEAVSSRNTTDCDSLDNESRVFGSLMGHHEGLMPDKMQMLTDMSMEL